MGGKGWQWCFLLLLTVHPHLTSGYAPVPLRPLPLGCWGAGFSCLRGDRGDCSDRGVGIRGWRLGGRGAGPFRAVVMGPEGIGGVQKNELERAQEELKLRRQKLTSERASPTASPAAQAGPQDKSQRRVSSAQVVEARVAASAYARDQRYGAADVAHGSVLERQDSSRAATATVHRQATSGPQGGHQPVTANRVPVDSGSWAQGQVGGGGKMMVGNINVKHSNEVQRQESPQPPSPPKSPQELSRLEGVREIIESLEQVTARQKEHVAPSIEPAQSPQENKAAARVFQRAAMKVAQVMTQNGGTVTDEGELNKFDKQISRTANSKEILKYLDAAQDSHALKHGNEVASMTTEQTDPFSKALGHAANVPRRNGAAGKSAPSKAKTVEFGFDELGAGGSALGSLADETLTFFPRKMGPDTAVDLQDGMETSAVQPVENEMASISSAYGELMDCEWVDNLANTTGSLGFAEHAVPEIDFPAQGTTIPQQHHNGKSRQMRWGVTGKAAAVDPSWLQIGSFDTDVADGDTNFEKINWGGSMRSLESFFTIREGSKARGSDVDQIEGRNVQGVGESVEAPDQRVVERETQLERLNEASAGAGASVASPYTVEEEGGYEVEDRIRKNDSADWDDELEIEDEDLELEVAFMGLPQPLNPVDHDMRVAYVTDHVIGIRSTWPDGYEIVEDFLIDKSMSSDETLNDVDQSLVLLESSSGVATPRFPSPVPAPHVDGGIHTPSTPPSSAAAAERSVVSPGADDVEGGAQTVKLRQQPAAIQVGTAVHVKSRNFRFKDAIGTVLSFVGNGKRARVQFQGSATPSLLLVASLVPATEGQQEAGAKPLYRGPSVPPAAMTTGTSRRWWKTRTSPDCTLDKSKFHSKPLEKR